MRHSLSILLGRHICVVALAVAFATFAVVQEAGSASLPTPEKFTQSSRIAPEPNSAAILAPSLSTLYAILRTGKINGSFDAFGQIGTSWQLNDASIPQFEMPAGSGVEYLFAGAIWVGGVVGTDTLVTVGADGWQNVTQLYPDGYTPSAHVGSISPIGPVGDSAYRAECTDTLHKGVVIPPDVISGLPYRPLPIKVASRVHLWQTTPADHCLLYDVVITNIGAQTIQDGFAALYMDCDVGANDDYNRPSDDVTGSFPDSGIAYILDNNGDFDKPKQALGGIAARLLAHSWDNNRSSYNWWMSNTVPAQDFGPMKNANFRNFQTGGGTGTPEGAANKYFLMSHGEWDYDQVRTATTGLNDSTWRAPSELLARQISKGFDTRFLLSFGPFALEPDSSVRFIFSVFGADSVHSDSLNGRYISDSSLYDPDQYETGLSLAGISRMGTVAESLSQFLLDPMTEAYGLKLARQTSDSIAIEWDDWGFADIDGYNIYLSPIPDSAFPVPGVIPAWYEPETPDLVAQVGHQHHYTFTGLVPNQTYVVNVAHRFGAQTGSLGAGLRFRAGLRQPAPIALDTLTFFNDGTGSLVRWHQPSGRGVDHFNIYKFDAAGAANKYLPFYTAFPQDLDDSMQLVRNGRTWYYYAYPVYDRASGADSTYLDMSPHDLDRYAVIAVDSQGYMSDYSSVSITREATRSKDVLVLFNSRSTAVNGVRKDSVEAFYRRVLDPDTYDLYSWSDTANRCGWFNDFPACVDVQTLMPYRLLIIDDGLYDGIMETYFENYRHAFATYLESGGHIAYCGSFSQMGGLGLSGNAQPAFYARTSPFISHYFGIDSVFYVGSSYYLTFLPPRPTVDTLFGFARGEAIFPAPNDAVYDAANPRTTVGNWPIGTPPSVSTFHLTAAGRPIYTYRSISPSSSMNEGQTVGVQTVGQTTTTYLYGFHIWSLEPGSAKGLVDWMITESREGPTGVTTTDPTLPKTFVLAQNYPNPFNPSTTIKFSLPRAAHVTLDIYNVLGQKVNSLVGADLPAGEHRVVWSGTNFADRPVSSGTYFYRLHAGDQIATRKMMLLK